MPGEFTRTDDTIYQSRREIACTVRLLGPSVFTFATVALTASLVLAVGAPPISPEAAVIGAASPVALTYGVLQYASE
jgi:hypothetical protein